MIVPIVIQKKGSKKTTPALSATSEGKSDMEYNLKNLAKLIALNRRNFIKLIVGGAVGINLTPLPWKFTDDIAIWTQN